VAEPTGGEAEPEATRQVVAIEDLLRALTLDPIGEDRYRAEHAEAGHGVVFGGELLGQSIVAAAAGNDGKRVKTVHTVFPRAASSDAPADISVDRMHAGRAFASSTVTISQGDRLCARSLVLLSADEPDLMRHADPAPPLSPPAEDDPVGDGSDAWQIRFVGGVDINDPDAVGPAELDVWTRFVGAPDDPAISQALLAYATDGFLIATAMRPHAGVGQSQAHVSLSTGVISHTLTFHEHCAAGEWFLLAHRSPYAGRGRAYGRADVFCSDGVLAASFVQDAMIRPLDTARAAPKL
jgi:acyl-CoA thioesterase-2